PVRGGKRIELEAFGVLRGPAFGDGKLREVCHGGLSNSCLGVINGQLGAVATLGKVHPETKRFEFPGGACQAGLKATTALVPPKAKALLIAARTSRLRATLGVTSRSQAGSFSR